MSLGCLCLTMASQRSFLFLCNFNTTLAVTGTLETGTNIQYLCMLVCGEAFLHFDSFSADAEITEILNV